MLPEPPSVNRYKRVSMNGKLYSTKKYLEWKKAAGWELLAQRIGAPRKVLAGDLFVEMVFARRGDLDNRIKPLLDLLQDVGIYANDEQVVRLTATFGERAGRCRVTVSEIVGIAST